MTPRILVACIGNIFMGDDAFGVEVAQRLAGRKLPDGVKVVDYGIRGLDLAYALLDGYDLVILVDAVPRGEAPGALYLIKPETTPGAGPSPLDAHGMNPMKVLAMVEAMGRKPERVLLVGCEPSPVATADYEESMGLSEPVAAAVDGAVELIESLIADAGKASPNGVLSALPGRDRKEAEKETKHEQRNHLQNHLRSRRGGVLCHAATRPEALH